MVEPLVGNGNRLPVRIEQADFTGAGDDLPDTPEGKVELGGEGSDLGALFGCGRKDKLVVITTGQLALARQLRIGAGGQIRQLTENDFRIDARTLSDMSEIGEQTVRDVDGRTSELAFTQDEAEFDTRQRPLQRGNTARD